MAASQLLSAINAICDTTITVDSISITGIRPDSLSPQIHVTPCHFVPLSGIQVNMQRMSMGGKYRYQYTIRHLMLFKSIAQNKLDDTFPHLLNYIAKLPDVLEAIGLPDTIKIHQINQAETGVITYPSEGEVSFASVETPIVLIESV